MLELPALLAGPWLSDTLSSVKLLRVWLLVLLTVVLPVRGALAAAMLCTPTGMKGHESSLMVEQGDCHGHGAVAQDTAGHDKCNLCSASCSCPPLPSAIAGIDEPQAVTAASFPEVSAAAPTFLSDGQERPPRTL
jgi:hypothetical protein